MLLEFLNFWQFCFFQIPVSAWTYICPGWTNVCPGWTYVCPFQQCYGSSGGCGGWQQCGRKRRSMDTDDSIIMKFLFPAEKNEKDQIE